MFHYFKLIKQNDKLSSLYPTMQSLQDGAIVLSLTARPLPKPQHYSPKFMITYLKNQIQDAYKQNNFVRGSAGLQIYDFFQKEFDMVMKLSPEKVWEVHSQYKLRYSVRLVEEGRFSRAVDYTFCERFTITRNQGDLEVAEVFSSAKMDTFRKPAIELRLMDQDTKEVYLTYKLITHHGIFPIFNSLLIVFRIAQVRICRYKEKYMKWIIKTVRPPRVFYSQNTEWEYTHPCYNKYVQTEDIFWRGDMRNIKNERLNLYFSPKNCEKQEFLRLCEAVRRQKVVSYSVEASIPDPLEIQYLQIWKYPNFQRHIRYWIEYSKECHQFPSLDFEEIQQSKLVKQASYLPQGIFPCYQNVWLYTNIKNQSNYNQKDQKNPNKKMKDHIEYLPDLVLARCLKQDQFELNHKWKIPFPHISTDGVIKIGDIQFLFLGGSNICQRRREFYLIRKRPEKIAKQANLMGQMNIREAFSGPIEPPWTHSLTSKYLGKKVNASLIKSYFFSLHNDEMDSRSRIPIKQSFSNYNEDNIGWINSKVILQFTHKPVEKILINIGGIVGYVTPFLDDKIDMDFYLNVKKQDFDRCQNTLDIIEIVFEKPAYVTDEILLAFEEICINYQNLKFAHQINYTRLSNCFKEFIMSRIIHEYLRDFSLWTEINYLQNFGLSFELQRYICQTFEKEMTYSRIGSWLEPYFLLGSQKELENTNSINLSVDSVITNFVGKDVFVIIKTMQGYKIVKFKGCEEYNKYLSRSVSKYIIFNNKLRDLFKNDLILVITCQNLKNKLLQIKELTQIQQIIDRSINIPPDTGYLSYIRKYLQTFGSQRMIPFNFVKSQQITNKWLSHLKQSASQAQPLKYCKEQIRQFLKQANIQIDFYSSLADCTYFDLFMSQINTQYLYSLKKAYHQLLNTLLDEFSQCELVDLICKNEFGLSIKYIQLHYLLLRCFCLPKLPPKWEVGS